MHRLEPNGWREKGGGADSYAQHSCKNFNHHNREHFISETDSPKKYATVSILSLSLCLSYLQLPLLLLSCGNWQLLVASTICICIIKSHLLTAQFENRKAPPPPPTRHKLQTFISIAFAMKSTNISNSKLLLCVCVCVC